MTGTVERLSDENGLLRQRAGLAATHHIDVSGVQLAKASLPAATLAPRPLVMSHVWHILHDVLSHDGADGSCTCLPILQLLWHAAMITCKIGITKFYSVCLQNAIQAMR